MSGWYFYLFILNISWKIILLSFLKKYLQHQQEQALNQILSGIPVSEKVTNSDLFRAALFDLKAWNVSVFCTFMCYFNTDSPSLFFKQMAPIHITPTTPEVDPVNITFNNIRLTAAINFRKLYPGAYTYCKCLHLSMRLTKLKLTQADPSCLLIMPEGGMAMSTLTACCFISSTVRLNVYLLALFV